MTSPLSDPKTSGDFAPDYFDVLYAWLDAGGSGAVVNWLRNRAIKASVLRTAPPVTKGKVAIIESAAQVRRNQVDDVWEDFCQVINDGKRPPVFFHRDLTDFARAEAFDDSQRIVSALNAKNFHFKMAERGYDMVRNPGGSEWRAGKFRSRMAFADKCLPRDEQLRLIAVELDRRANGEK